MHRGNQGISYLVETPASEISLHLDRCVVRMQAILCMSNNNYVLRPNALFFNARVLVV